MSSILISITLGKENLNFLNTPTAIILRFRLASSFEMNRLDLQLINLVLAAFYLYNFHEALKKANR